MQFFLSTENDSIEVEVEAVAEVGKGTFFQPHASETSGLNIKSETYACTFFFICFDSNCGMFTPSLQSIY